MAYTLGTLRTYVRNLTGVFSTDLLPDSTITTWINEVYLDVARQQEWPWQPAVVPLVNSSDAPAFADEFAPLLAYRTAAKVLIAQADETQRAGQYMVEYQTLLDGMYQDDLQATASSSVSSDAAVQAYVRALLNIYDDTLTSSVISGATQDTYNDLQAARSWPNFPLTPIPYNIVGVGRALAYGAAARLAERYGKPAEFVANMQSEYSLALAYLVQTQLSNTAATGIVLGPSNTRGSLGWLRNHVKLLTGEYSKAIPDVMINDMINEEYRMLCSAKDWQWLRKDIVFTYPANASFYQLPTTGSSFLQPTAPYKVQYVFIVRTNVSNAVVDAVHFSALETEVVHNVPHVLDAAGSDIDYRYEIDVFGRFRITPTPTQNLTVKMRHLEMVRAIPGDTDTVIFDDRFAAILSYRTAVAVLIMSGANDKRVELYDSKANDLYTLMEKEYQLSSSNEPLQLGSSGLITRKYLPWFRTA